MNKLITTKYTFNNRVLQVEINVMPEYQGQIVLKSVLFEEYDTDDGEYNTCIVASPYDDVVEFTNDPTQHVAVLQFPDDVDRIVRCKIALRPIVALQNPPCCAEMEGDNIIYYEYFVDMTAYERTMLSSINLKCNDCDVPLATVNGLLKLFAVRAAAESHDPSLERIFSKLTCGSHYATPHVSHTNCNCNG